MSNGLKTRLTLVGRDHAEGDRSRFLSAEERDDRGLPGPAMAVAFVVAATLATGACLYYGTALVLYGLYWIAVVLG